MVNAVTIKCPDCNANLEYEQGRTTLFCQFCGAKIFLMNENEHVYKHIDEAGMKYAETERIIRLKELELQEKKSEQKKKYILMWIITIAVLGVLALVFGLLGKEEIGGVLCLADISVAMYGFIALLADSQTTDKNDQGKIKLPMSISSYKNMDYHTVEAELRRAGFYNIRCIAVYDLKTGFIYSQDQVASLSVDGNQNIEAGRKYLPGAPIVITYHSFGKR